MILATNEKVKKCHVDSGWHKVAVRTKNMAKFTSTFRSQNKCAPY
jgi:hypothetical protein